MPERVSVAIRAYVSTAAADPRWTRIAFVEVVGVSPAVEAHRIEWRERLSQLVEAEAALAISRGEATERSFKLTSMAFFGAVNELVYHWSNNGRQVPLKISAPSSPDWPSPRSPRPDRPIRWRVRPLPRRG